MDGSHMRETDADRDVRDGAYRVAADELRQFVERAESLPVIAAEYEGVQS